MAGRGVKAGDTYLRLGLEGSERVEKALRGMATRLGGIGAGLRQAGTVAAAAGTAIVGTLGTAAKIFASTGDDIDKMAARTGFSAESLSRLGFAAEQSGQSIGQLESVLIGQSRQIRNLERGLSTAVDAFDDIGLSYEDLRDLSPEEQFLTIADRLAAIEDPTRRAGIAMQVFGRSGRNLIPMLSAGRDGITQLTDEADQLGLTMSSENAAAAAELTDALNRFARQVRMIVVEVGAAVAGPLSNLLSFTTTYLTAAIEWVRNNRALIQTIAAVGVAIAAAGTGVVALGGGFAFAGLALSGLATVLSFVLSPLGLLLTAVAGGTAYFFAFTEAGRQMATDAAEYFGDLGAIAGETFAGIQKALAGGDLEAAAAILWAGLEVAWLRGTAPLRKLWADVSTFFVNTWSAAISGIAQTFNSLTGNVERGWRLVGDLLLGGADSIVTGLTVMLNNLLGFFEKTWARIKGFFGGDATAEIARINRELEASNDVLRKQRQDRKSGREADRAAFNADSLRRQRETSDVLADDLQRKFDAAQGDADEALAAAERRLAAAREELGRLNEEQATAATQAAEEVAKKATAGIKDAASRSAGQSGGQSGVGTFNALAIASLLSPGGSTEEEQLAELKRQTEVFRQARLVMTS